MTVLTVTSFSGEYPRFGQRVLPETHASATRNLRAVSGEIRPRLQDVLLADLGVGYTVRYAYRIVEGVDTYWLTFSERNTDVVKSPIVNDSHKRYFFTSTSSTPAFNTLARVASGDPSFKLGVVPPSSAPSLAITAAGSGSSETRAYLITYSDVYGQESAPSTATLLTCNDDAEITVSWGAVSDQAGYAGYQYVNVYRTVPGESTSVFFYVGRTASSNTSFLDNIPAAATALNDVLQSTTWAVPPDLDGFVAHPNGFLVGFKGRDVYFSEPYRPHAWPVEYTLSVADDIVALGIFGSNIAVLTDGTPYVVSGIRPEAMSITNLVEVAPCVSRRSVATLPGSVVYASIDGLMLLTSAGIRPALSKYVSRDEWLAEFSPYNIMATTDSSTKYTGFFDERHGFEFDFSEPDRGLIRLSTSTDVDGFNYDPESGRPLICTGGRVYSFSDVGALPYFYMWRSKVFYLPRPLNFGACEINFVSENAVVGGAAEQLLVDFNTSRLATRSAPLGSHALASSASQRLTSVDPQNRAPLGGSALYYSNAFASPSSIQITVWGDNRELISRKVPTNRAFRLPSGVKYKLFQFEVSGTAKISTISFAETRTELRRV